MTTRHARAVAAVGLPDLLTVEEAARLIRVGRTKAYAMTREWRDTNGHSGLPVVDFGSVLRVPRRALEALIGAEFEGALPEPDGPVAQDAPETVAASPVGESADAAFAPERDQRAEGRTSSLTRRTGRKPQKSSDQLALFDATTLPPRS